ncbi:GNAT family N-acetyltransferase [Metabacillus sp. GX 13764]|nr:GNAT family N-acetyltransferase [Metabacillus kandeliae]
MDEVKELHQFFEKVIADTFRKNGIHPQEGLAEEAAAKKKYLEADFASNGEIRYFLVAAENEKIIGSIEYGPASSLICKCTKNALEGTAEIGTLFVHPEYQKKGIGNSLLKAKIYELQNRGIRNFCLDSGYPSSQKIWKKKFGKPDYFLKDYWAEGFHHMIWQARVSDFL